MFVFQRHEEDFRQPMVLMVYSLMGIVGIVYALLETRSAASFLGALADVGGALFVFALVSEGVVWNMVLALGKIGEARAKGREEGRVVGQEEGREQEREAMIQALRDAGLSEEDIQRVEAKRAAGGNA